MASSFETCRLLNQTSANIIYFKDSRISLRNFSLHEEKENCIN